MWHEARKQEKKIREVMVDFQKRAERRREHYDRVKVDPSVYLRLVGTKCPLRLDPTGGKLNDTSMIPWQGNPDNMISRYDVRVHMDYIPENIEKPTEKLSGEALQEEIRCNYERYRSLVHHDFKGDNESDVLSKLEVEDVFSEFHKKRKKTQKVLNTKPKAAIGFDYNDIGGVSSSTPFTHESHEGDDSGEGSNDEFKIDFDVDDLSTKQIDKLNVLALDYGISRGFHSKSLRSEKSSLMERKDFKMMEMEKSALSGKKARKERRLYKDNMMRTRDYSPPLYMGRDSPTYEPYHRENSKSSESSQDDDDDDGDTPAAMEYITEFGATTLTTPTTSERRTQRSRRRHSSSSSSTSTSPPPSSRYGRGYHRSRTRSRERRSYHRRDHSPHYRGRSRSRSRSPSRITKHKLKPTSTTKDKTEKKSKLTPQERLKRKMQAQLSKTFKEDKKAEKQKAYVKEVKEMEREEKLREDTRKLKHRQGL